MHETDILIVGAGIVGLTIAREYLASGVDRIMLVEKEPAIGYHASGRNSGVLHAGIYYPPETLKAQLCLQGNRLLQAYCEQNQLPLKKCGKVIVTRNERELPVLHDLYQRSLKNGANVELIDEFQLAALEPNAKTHQQALYSHDTAVVDNKIILQTLRDELLRSKRVSFLYDAAFIGLQGDYIAKTKQGNIRFQRFINAAGAYADVVAHHFDLAKEYCLIPFKGIYQKLVKEQAHLVNGNIYPVPNLGNPFLGVHFTKNIAGDVYVGPTAIPAFGRENYGVVRGMDRECFSIIWNEIRLFATNKGFRKVALEEPKKYLPRYFFNDAKKLVKVLHKEWLTSTTKVGIRPQLVNLKQKTLMMDFMLLQSGHSLHILNAISPAFTSSMAFASYVRQHFA